MDNFKNLTTLDVSLYRDYTSGKITLREAAEKFYSHGWTNFLDEDYTLRQFERISLTH